MHRFITKRVLLIMASVLLVGPRTASACSACIGSADSTATQGLNAAVLTLLTAWLLVMGAVVCFLACLVRRSLKHPLALPSMPGGVAQ